jgi:hypothetical protein
MLLRLDAEGREGRLLEEGRVGRAQVELDRELVDCDDRFDLAAVVTATGVERQPFEVVARGGGFGRVVALRSWWLPLALSWWWCLRGVATAGGDDHADEREQRHPTNSFHGLLLLIHNRPRTRTRGKLHGGTGFCMSLHEPEIP